MQKKPREDLIATLSNSLVKILSGPLILIFIPMFLNQVEQGYWYTFTSIAALSIFADLGFSTIVLQFSAHEFSGCRFGDNNIIVGSERKVLKLASFFRFAIFWLVKVCSVIFPIIIIGGYFFLQSKNNNVKWEIPWLIYSSMTTLLFINATVLSFFEGCDSVAKIQNIRMKIILVNSITVLSCLYSNLNLYALSFSVTMSAITGSNLILWNFKNTIQQMWSFSTRDFFDWRPEFYSLIWRYAISWCSGYFIFQLFTPLAFKFFGSTFAGKIGISIAIWTAGCTIATTWLTAITPKLNMLVSEKKWHELDELFNKNLKLSLLTMVLGIVSYFVCYLLLEKEISFFERVLSANEMIMLACCWLMQVYINGVALYLRCHKREPMMPVSLFSAIYVSVTTYYCATNLSSNFLFVGFLSSYMFGVPVTYYLYRKQKEKHFS